MKADLIEETQQPGVTGREVARLVKAVPHLAGAPDKLITAGTLHAVHAQVRAADAHGVLRRPGARRVVFGGDQAMARVQRCGHRRAQVNVPQAQHQVGGSEDDLAHRLDRRQAVDAANELDVAGAPRGVGAHRLHVLADGQLGGGIVP